MASHGLPLPPFFADCFTEKGWTLMSEKERREMIEIMNADDVMTDETRRIHRETERKRRAAMRRLQTKERERREILLRQMEAEHGDTLLTKKLARALMGKDYDVCSTADNVDKSRRQRSILQQDLSGVQLRAGLPHHERQIYVNERREMIESMNEKDVITGETPGIHQEGQRKRRAAMQKLLKKEREQREFLPRMMEDEQVDTLLREEFSHALKCEDDDVCSAADNKDKSRRHCPIPQQDLSGIQLRAGLPHHERQTDVYPEVVATGGSTLLM